VSIVAGIRDLLAQGFTVEQALKAAEAFEPKKGARSSAAERQARYRARKSAKEGVTRDVTTVTSDVTASQSVTTVTCDAGTDLARVRVNPDLPSGDINNTPHIPPTSRRDGDAKRNRSADFARFWDRWPNKVGKPAAERAFGALASRGVAIDPILAGLDRYIRDKPPDRPWLNPATFLNQRRFEDQPAPANGTGPPGGMPQFAFEVENRRRLEEAARRMGQER